MSYNNNWVRTLSESYIQNNRPTNLQEQLDEQMALNEELLSLVDALCEELGIDVEDLLEDVQTDERDSEMQDEIARTTGKRRDKLIRQGVKEKESSAIFDRGGKKVGNLGKTSTLGGVLGGKKYESDDVAYAGIGNSGAEGQEKWAKEEAKKASDMRRRVGMGSQGETAAERAASDNKFALQRGLETEVEKQQEKDTGVKASIGKRISRAIDRVTGRARKPIDYRVRSASDKENEGITKTRRTQTGSDNRNW